jgi:uncharacterized protein YjiS (DUF1127 family)
MTSAALTGAPVSSRSVTDFFALIADWRRRRHFRAELRRLLRTGPHLLEDIGLPAVAAARESALPFWR